MVEELEDKLLFAAPPEWIKGPAVIRDGWIVLRRERAVLYRVPIGRSVARLAFDLAAVNTPHDALDFVVRYGMLDGRLFGDEYREPFAEWEREIKELRSMLNGFGRVRAATLGNAEAIREIRAIWGRVPGAEKIAAGSDFEVVDAASHEEARRLSSKIQYLRPFVVPESELGGSPGIFRFAYLAYSPLLQAYKNLADIVCDGGPVVRCANPMCGGFFEQRDKRQEYCSPACSNRMRQRRHAAKGKTRHGGDDGNPDGNFDGNNDTIVAVRCDE